MTACMISLSELNAEHTLISIMNSEDKPQGAFKPSTHLSGKAPIGSKEGPMEL
jgi:hypothetical protein